MIQNDTIEVEASTSDAPAGIATITLEFGDEALFQLDFRARESRSLLQDGRTTFGGLTHGRTYLFRVRATDRAGYTSEWAWSENGKVELYGVYAQGVGKSFSYRIAPNSDRAHDQTVDESAARWNSVATIRPDPTSANQVIVGTGFSWYVDPDVCGLYTPPIWSGNLGFRIEVAAPKALCGVPYVTTHEFGHGLGLDDRKWGQIQIMGYRRAHADPTPQYWDLEGVRRRWPV